MHSIELKVSFQRIGINIVGLLTIMKKENRYIVIAIDYFIKWSITKAIKEIMIKIISKFIYEKDNLWI